MRDRGDHLIATFDPLLSHLVMCKQTCMSNQKIKPSLRRNNNRTTNSVTDMTMQETNGAPNPWIKMVCYYAFPDAIHKLGASIEFIYSPRIIINSFGKKEEERIIINSLS